MNRNVICYVVTVVPQWRGVKREKPDSSNPKLLQIVKPLRKADEVADAVRIAIAERADMELVDNGILIPEVIFLPCQGSTLPSILKNLRSLAHAQSTTANC